MGRLSRLYGLTFLTRPRWETFDKEHAERSPFQWAEISLGREHQFGFNGRRYTLSLLGVVNGVLPRLPGRPVLVAVIDDRTHEVRRYRVRRAWWP